MALPQRSASSLIQILILSGELPDKVYPREVKRSDTWVSFKAVMVSAEGLVHNRWWCSFRCAQAKTCISALHARISLFGERGHFGQQGLACGFFDGNGPELARFDLRLSCGLVGQGQGDLKAIKSLMTGPVPL